MLSHKTMTSLRSQKWFLYANKCKKVFRKDMEFYEEADEFCPNCDNHYVLEAVTPEQRGKLIVEFEAKKGHEHKLFQDDREKEREVTLIDYQDIVLSDEDDNDFKI
mmetsp:Transcript_31417/g.27765  ORF Transcript_31417/g.27765 Transcript_31417/m.27765 type:complete len:106 (+) Transcript_31417:108-425(+)